MLQGFAVSALGRRVAAATAAAVVAGIGLVAAMAAPASAAGGADGAVSVTWGTPVLTIDLNSNGRPDLLDTVTITADVTALGADLRVLSLGGDNLLWPALKKVSAGTTETFSRTFVVTPGQLQGAGSTGPVLTGMTLIYLQSGQTHNVALESPPVLYTAPAPLTVSTTMDITAANPAAVVEGNTVGYTTTLTNTTPRVMTITSMPGYTDFPGSAVIAPGGSASFHHAPAAVTYADMAAGGIGFADATIAWSAAFPLPGAQVFTGTATASYPFVAAAAIDATVTRSANFTVNAASDGHRLGLGDAVAGDVINVKFDASNAGNVTMNYVGLTWNPAGTPESRTEPAAALTPGGSLPNGVVLAKHLKSAGNGVFSPYVLTDADIARGYVDVNATVEVAPSLAVFQANPAAYSQQFTERVFLKQFTLRAGLTITATLNDSNGDGIGQAGESIEYRVRFKNNSEQDQQIGVITDLLGSDVIGRAGIKFNGATVVADDAIAKTWTYAITAADETRGTVSYGAEIGYTGLVTGTSSSRSEWAPVIPTGPYIAPVTSLTASATYVDSNADGHPSIGETVTVTVTVTNTEARGLTGLGVMDGTPADATGLLPAFPSAVAGGGQETRTFDYVLKADDYARGSFSYAAAMMADGMPITGSTTSVLLTGITFQSNSGDLDAMDEGDIGVCSTAGAPIDTVVHGTPFEVMPGDCSFTGSPEGYRAVIFSTPAVLGVDTFNVTLPVGLRVGAHRIALYAPDGSLVGWRNVTVKDPVVFSGDGGVLAYTGADSSRTGGAAAASAALMIVGAAAVIEAGRRRRRTVG